MYKKNIINNENNKLKNKNFQTANFPITNLFSKFLFIFIRNYPLLNLFSISFLSRRLPISRNSSWKPLPTVERRLSNAKTGWLPDSNVSTICPKTCLLHFSLHLFVQMLFVIVLSLKNNDISIELYPTKLSFSVILIQSTWRHLK